METFIVVLLLLMPLVLLLRVLIWKFEITALHLVGITLLLIGFSGGLYIVRDMLTDMPALNLYSEGLAWFIVNWGFLYVNALILLTFLGLWLKQKRRQSEE